MRTNARSEPTKSRLAELYLGLSPSESSRVREHAEALNITIVEFCAGAVLQMCDEMDGIARTARRAYRFAKEAP